MQTLPSPVLDISLVRTRHVLDAYAAGAIDGAMVERLFHVAVPAAADLKQLERTLDFTDLPLQRAALRRLLLSIKAERQLQHALDAVLVARARGAMEEAAWARIQASMRVDAWAAFDAAHLIAAADALRAAFMELAHDVDRQLKDALRASAAVLEELVLVCLPACAQPDG